MIELLKELQKQVDAEMQRLGVLTPADREEYFRLLRERMAREKAQKNERQKIIRRAQARERRKRPPQPRKGEF